MKEQEIKIKAFWKQSFRTIKEYFGGSYHDLVHKAQIDTNKLIDELAELRKENERLENHIEKIERAGYV